MATTNKAFRVKTGLTVEGAELRPAQGTSSYPPILLTSGTNLGTPTQGAFEFDGTSFYLTATTGAGNRKTISFTDHVHGNILAGGTITSSVTATSPVKVLITDSSNAIGLLTTTNASGTTFLRGDGTWVTPVDVYPNSLTFTAGSTAGPTISIGMASGGTTVTSVAIPAAATGASGIITTGAQNIDGVKTFSSLPESSVVPTTNNQLTNKAYVDSVAVGIDWKPSVRVATLANITLVAAQTIDGVAVVANDRVLVKNQTTGSENGIWVVGSGNWTRATDADTSAEVTSSLAVFVEEGTQADTGWVLTNNGTITVGTTALNFTQFTGLGQITAGNGLTTSGNTISVNLDSSPVGLKFNSAKLAVDASQLWIGTTNVFLSGTTPISQALTGISSITGTVANLNITPASRVGIGTGYTLGLQGGNTDTSAAGPVNINGGTSTAANAAGGAVTIAGGVGTGTANGGSVLINGGASGTGTPGKVVIGGDSITTTIDIGLAATTTTQLKGAIQIPNLASGSDTNFVKFNSTTKALTYDTTTYVGAASPALTGTPTINSIGAIATTTFTTSGTTAGTSGTIFSTATYTGAEIVIKAVNSTTIEIIKALVVIDSSGNVYNTQYADIQTGTQLIGTLDYTTTSNNFVISITPQTGTTGTTTYKAVLTLIAI